MKKAMMKGFTLIEIMIVVAIIAILAAVAIPNFLKYQKESIKSTCRSNMATIKTAAEAWAMAQDDVMGACPTLTGSDGTALVAQGGTSYLKEEPKCKAGGTYTITRNANGVFTVSCSYQDHGSMGADE